MLNFVRKSTAALLLVLTALLPFPVQAVDDIQDYSATAASNTNIGGINFAESMQRSNVNNGIRELIAQIKRAVANQGSDIASASSTAICATGTSAYAKVTGTTTITSFGTAAAGCSRWITFTGALILTHNGTSLILPGAANFTTEAGDMIWAVSEGSGNWRVRIFPVDGGPVISPIQSAGIHKLWIPAAAMRPDGSSPPVSADVVVTDVQYYALGFDDAAVNKAHFNISMPSSWNESTVTFVPIWTASSGSGGVVWRLRAVAKSNDDAIDATYSGSVTSTDTLITASDLHRGPESSALTIDGTPAANDTVFFEVARLTSDGSDTLATGARIIGIELYVTTDAAVDAP